MVRVRAQQPVRGFQFPSVHKVHLNKSILKWICFDNMLTDTDHLTSIRELVCVTILVRLMFKISSSVCLSIEVSMWRLLWYIAMAVRTYRAFCWTLSFISFMLRMFSTAWAVSCQLLLRWHWAFCIMTHFMVHGCFRLVCYCCHLGETILSVFLHLSLRHFTRLGISVALASVRSSPLSSNSLAGCCN